MPLHLGTLTPEQILEINFLAGAIVSKKPEMAADKLVAELAAIYQSTDKSQVESQIAKLMEVKENKFQMIFSFEVSLKAELGEYWKIMPTWASNTVFLVIW